MEEEEWKQIKGYEGLYEVSNLGQVRNKNKLILRLRINQNGYLIVNLHKEGKQTTVQIHRLVGIAFIEKTDYRQTLIDHKNRVRTDNRAENLRWVTISQNGMNRKLQKNNTSGYAGVRRNKKSKNWRAYIKIDGKSINGGNFTNKEDAIARRKELEKQYFGEYAVKGE